MVIMALRKTALFLCMEDVLVPGKIDSGVDAAEVRKILGNLHRMEEKNALTMVLISGYCEKIAKRLVGKFGLGSFFRGENIFSVTEDYINSKAEIDREMHLANLKKDASFKDEYFKQHIIRQFLEKGIPKEQMLLIGHDAWTDGFYTMRFSGIDFALVREAYSERHKAARERVKGLVYIKRKWGDIRRVIKNFPKPDYSALDRHCYETMKEHLLGDAKILPHAGQRN